MRISRVGGGSGIRTREPVGGVFEATPSGLPILSRVHSAALPSLRLSRQTTDQSPWSVRFHGKCTRARVGRNPKASNRHWRRV
jgi:hypothetical protein